MQEGIDPAVEQHLATNQLEHESPFHGEVSDLLGLQEEATSDADEGSDVGEGARDLESHLQDLDHRTKALPCNPAITVLTKQAGLDELAPRHVGRTGGLGAKYRRTGASTLAPPATCRRGNTQTSRCLSQRVPGAFECHDPWHLVTFEIPQHGSRPAAQGESRQCESWHQPATPSSA